MKKTHFEKLKKSVKQMKNIERGSAKPSRVYKYPDVSKIRKKLHVSQREFSKRLGISSRTLENWEQSRRAPTGPARVLLSLLELQPTRVWNLSCQVSGYVKMAKTTRRTKTKRTKTPA